MAPPLVLIHGIKGSMIYDRHNNPLYLTLKQALGWKTPILKLPIEWEVSEEHGARQKTDGSKRGRAIEQVAGPLSKFVGAQGYHKILFWARQKYGSEIVVHGFLGEAYSNADDEMMEKMALGSTSKRFFVFTYDWRRDNNENAIRLINFMKVLNKIHGEKGQVVAHSNGGLLAWNAVNSHPQLFHSALFAAVPFGPSLNFLKDMNTQVGFKSLSPDVLFTHPCYYSFFPVYKIKNMDGTDCWSEVDSKARIFDIEGNPVEMDWTDAKAWKEMDLLFPTLDGAGEKEKRHLQHCLDQAILFRKSMEVTDAASLPPLAVLVGDSIPTKTGCVMSVSTGSNPKKTYDFDDSRTVMLGDGRIPTPNAFLPGDCKYDTYTTKKSHSNVLDEVELVEQILASLQGKVKAREESSSLLDM
mmetsp:Transcript_17748/g.22638  ORF Transcript_17748/g.22638 Transcript_17748/m.22638 type:complete len:413 (+) Transcript_17748:143-1381(+)|eukprot:CAMPEP_0204861778 /NCGR_PEP_ID=MMETSP1348-20121228/1887_1 /ASSEMBLY_ACC=CAM_ASM_000700 /TAXON_ID=215587 /ORGANISM="Aplanochytrium stocchinoi, Strain GSBS06" /LENGTH=412 /DNA_ID=CAMNT_0052011345 /DNA_START=44 /DNA_END=1282 /DNA_ORIENTATION=+